MHKTPLVNVATATAALTAALIFVVDLNTPLGFGLAALYIVPLLVGTLNGPARFQLVAAGVASLLTLLGWWLAPAGVAPALALTNRAIALVAIWSTALVLGRFRHTWLDLQTRTKDLTDIEFTLNQSAIVATTDAKGAITFVNQKFCDVSKYSREELLGQDHRILNSGYHPTEFIRNLWVTIANGRIWRGEIRNRAKDGSIYWVDTTIVPFLDERRKPYKYMAIRYEITDRKRSEERLREQEGLARLGQMAAVVAHEVKNPIAGIRGALQVIGSRMPAESRDKPIVGEVIARLDSLNGIVQDLLVFARPRELRCEPVDLASLIHNTLDLLRRDPALAGLQVNIAGDGGVVPGDPEQLQIVFTNVVMNAAQAMSGAGAIPGDIDINIVRGGSNTWTVLIADQGPGMPPDVREKVFEPFFTTKSRGTGLGLSIARRIVEAHGGAIQIDIPEQGGTVVSISLPAASQAHT